MADHTPPKTLLEHLDDVKAIATTAANRAEIAVRAADSADLSARASKAKLDEMTRLEHDDQGRPGVLPWIASELAALRADVHPFTHMRGYLTAFALAVAAGALGGGLLTCVVR